MKSLLAIYLLNNLFKNSIYLFILVLVTACGGGGGGSAPVAVSEVKISWNKNTESAVNKSGGGYKIYYSPNSGFATDDSGVVEIDVPYVSGTLSPTSVKIKPLPSSGSYYLRVAAYSALADPELAGGSISAATFQTTFLVP